MEANTFKQDQEERKALLIKKQKQRQKQIEEDDLGFDDEDDSLYNEVRWMLKS